MTQPRPYRAGLGLPEAIVIRSDPPPSTRQRELFEEAQQGLAEREWNPNQGQIWSEWNINPARHGPERLTKVPIFVKGTGNYDELGRSALEGSGVEIDQGRKRRVSGEEGQDLGEWYRGLATRVKVNGNDVKQENLGAGTKLEGYRPNGLEEKPVTGPQGVIDLSQDDDLIDPLAVDTKPDANSIRPEAFVDSSLPHSTSSRPLRVNQSEWFIRRALLAQDRSTSSSAHSSPGPSFISTMLNIGQSQPRPLSFQYALGPENKGYELLQTRHGWEGGGLGRPADWEERQRVNAEAGPSRSRPRSPVPLELDVNGEQVVDLTADSEEEEEEEFMVPPTQTGGPGRTAPIATSLKLDRLGLGHQRSTKAARDAEKKVTHTIDEIRRVQQRSRYPPPKQGVELGKKGKIRWKERDKKEREERKRMMAMLNS